LVFNESEDKVIPIKDNIDEEETKNETATG